MRCEIMGFFSTYSRIVLKNGFVVQHTKNCLKPTKKKGSNG